MKIVGIGLNKTGTTTLGVCMHHWGLKHMTFHPETFALWRDRNIQALLEWMDELDSFADWPWPLIYPEIDQHFPNTKFILTRRKDPQTWFRSLCNHADKTGPTIYREIVYGYAMPHHHQQEHVQFYEDHLRAVREYFGTRPFDLLEVCWEEGDGWQELVAFLEFNLPEIPFPHENKST